MRTYLLAFLCVLAGLMPGLAAEVLDRIAVTVDKHVITESDVIRYLRVAAFLDRKPVDLSGSAKRAAAAALVDRSLILEESENSHFTLPSTSFVSFLSGMQLGDLSIEPFIDNLTDAHPLTNYAWSVINPGYTRLLQGFTYRPRTFGVTFTYHH